MTGPCPNCQQAVDESSRYCPHCGAELDSDGTLAASAPRPGGQAQRSSGDPDRFRPGQVLAGRFRIVQRIGRGGMGEVYRADDLELEQPVALKFLPEQFARDEHALSMLRSEVRLARKVSHAHVCRLYDLGQSDGDHFISMEYVEGENLAEVLQRMGRPTREKAEELARQICMGVAAAHEVGIIHRDLKPANILIDARGRARVTDFGVAGLSEELEESGDIAGTLEYMAPEQRAGGKVSVQSDIYSLGLVLHELFAGQRAVESGFLDPDGTSRESGSSSTFVELDPAVERLIRRCLEEEPGARPRSVYDVLAFLPGGDPVAAALAAGETPSPDVLASVRGGLAIQPRTVVILAVTVVASLIATALLNGRTARVPARDPSELAFIAGEIAKREFGLAELPPHDAGGIIRNPRYETEGEPPFLAWRRWSRTPIESQDFHSPSYVQLNRPRHVNPGSVAIVLDDTGVLLEASVIAEPRVHDPTAEADLRPLLALAGIDADTVVAERLDPAELDPPLRVHCDHVTVWRHSPQTEPVARAGVYAGQVVAFQRADYIAGAERLVDQSDAPTPFIVLVIVAFLLMFCLAARNLHVDRVDWQGALRTGVVTLVAYLLIEAFAFDLDRELLRQIMGLHAGRAGGHAVLHFFQIVVIYLAFEPIARRVWPRLLVGWARAIHGRLRDSRVGAEILIGLTAACLAVLLLNVVHLFGGERVLPDMELMALSGPAMTASKTLSAVAHSLYGTMFAVALIVTPYVLTRSPLLGLIIGALLLSATGFGQSHVVLEYSFAPALVFGLTNGALVVLLFARSGLITILVYTCVSQFLRSVLVTSDLAAWHGPYTIFAVVIVLLLLAHGVRSALSGREQS